MTRQSKHAIVIGAGIGGLAAAARLAHAGMRVTVLERASQPGGKLATVNINGATLDVGPTVFTMRWVFDALFTAIGERFDEHVALAPLTMLARHSWSETERFDLFADVEQSAAAVAQFSGAAEATRFVAFCARAKRIYDTLNLPFIQSAQPSMSRLIASALPGGMLDLSRIAPFRSLWSTLGDYFHDPRLRQLFGRYATYCGGSPWLSPGTLMLVAHVEQSGVWSVRSGMHSVALAVAARAVAQGAEFRYGCAVKEIVTHGGAATGIVLDSGEVIAADVVISNADVAALSSGLLGKSVSTATPRVARSQRSLSAFTLALIGNVSGFPLHRHNVFFCDDYAREFADIRERARLPASPTVYVCAQDRDDTCAAPGAPERLFCIVNAPANGDSHAFTEDETARCEAAVFALFAKHRLHVDFQPENLIAATPNEFAQRFPGTGGALYGRAPHGWLSSFQRPGVRSKVHGLYLAGGSTHPGPGVATAALSGHHAAIEVLKDFS